MLFYIKWTVVYRVIAEPADMKSSDMLIKKAILEDLNTTENPLWIEQLVLSFGKACNFRLWR